MDQDADELDDGPNISSGRRMKSPVRAPATKRNNQIHNEEPATKRSIIDELSDDDGDGIDVDSLRAKLEDMLIIGRALSGQSLHDIYSNSRINLAVCRQTAESSKGGLISADVAEIFSPERVATVCREFGSEPRLSMDIKSGYDFDNKKDRDRCWEAIERDTPTLVIGSPPCTSFSRLQELNKFVYKDDQLWMLKFQEQMEQAKRYVEFCAKVYKFQIDNGRHFLHEHPYLATSWGLDCVAKLMNREDVTRVLTHMCRFGMTSRVGGKGSELGPVLCRPGL